MDSTLDSQSTGILGSISWLALGAHQACYLTGVGKLVPVSAGVNGFAPQILTPHWDDNVCVKMDEQTISFSVIALMSVDVLKTHPATVSNFITYSKLVSLYSNTSCSLQANSRH